MGKYYCDYCDVFLTHDSQSVRKAHNSGRNHVQNVIDYYNGKSPPTPFFCLHSPTCKGDDETGLGHNQAQSLIDRITRQYEGGPPGMGMGMGMGGPPVMRSANPPFMGGGPQGFRPPQGYPPFQGGGPPGSAPFFPPPPGGQGFPPPGMGIGMPMNNGYPARPPQSFGGPGIGAGQTSTPDQMQMGVPQQQQQQQPQGVPSGLSPAGASGPPVAQFTSAPPGAANGRAPMINPERMRMMGM